MQDGHKEHVLKSVLEYLQAHSILTMATASASGEPDATALEYVNDGLDVYVTVRPGSRKVQYLLENPRVFFEIHDDIPIDARSIRSLRAVQATCSASILRSGDPGFDEAFQLFEKKFPVFTSVPRSSRHVLKFTPKRAWFLNYKDKLFHRDELVL